MRQLGELLKDQEEKMLSMKRHFRNFILWSYPVIVIVCLVFIGMDSWILNNGWQELKRDNERRKNTYAASRLISGALKNYYDNNGGRSPKSLEELVPKYLDTLPQPSWGDTGWVYRSDGNEVNTFAVGYMHSDRYPPFLYHFDDGGGFSIVED
jgi:hypothetical protein